MYYIYIYSKTRLRRCFPSVLEIFYISRCKNHLIKRSDFLFLYIYNRIKGSFVYRMTINFSNRVIIKLEILLVITCIYRIRHQYCQ